MMPKLERKWSVDCDLHIIRKLGYKGHQVAADAVQRPRLSFDGVTLPGLFFMATQLQWLCLPLH